MTKLIKIKAGDSEFWIEPDTTVATERKTIPASVGIEDIEKVVDFNKFSKEIGDICTLLKKSFDDIPKDLKPSKVTTEFGLKISGEGNIFIVKAGVEATLTISIEWQFS